MGAIIAHHGLLLADAGGGVAVGRWNPADKHADIVLSSSDTQANNGVAGNWRSVRGVTSHSIGKWYAEFNVTSSSINNLMCGIATSAATLASFPGSDAFGWSIQNDGSTNIRNNGANTPTALTPPGTNERFMVAYDAATGKIWLGARGVWYNSGDPAAGTNPTFTASAGTVMFLAAGCFTAGQVIIRNGSGENLHTIPSGYTVWG